MGGWYYAELTLNSQQWIFDSTSASWAQRLHHRQGNRPIRLHYTSAKDSVSSDSLSKGTMKNWNNTTVRLEEYLQIIYRKHHVLVSLHREFLSDHPHFEVNPLSLLLSPLGVHETPKEGSQKERLSNHKTTPPILHSRRLTVCKFKNENGAALGRKEVWTDYCRANWKSDFLLSWFHGPMQQLFRDTKDHR